MSGLGLGQGNKEAAAEKKSLEVTRFEITEGIEFPDPSLDKMMTEIVEELTKTKKFESVSLTPAIAPVRARSDAVEPKTETAPLSTDVSLIKVDDADLVMTGTITKFKPGNRAARYLIGFGAGMTKIVALVKVVEKATGKILMEENVDGKVIIGLFGGDSKGATRGLAKEVASDTKKALSKSEK